MTRASAAVSGSMAVIAGGGTLPFAVADAVIAQGRRPVLFALRGFCDPARLAAYSHHWISIGQFGRLTRLLRGEGCRDIVFIGSLVRPGFSDLRFDWGTLRVLREGLAAFRGGDDFLLTGIARLFERDGFRLLGLSDVAPSLLMPEGSLTRRRPDASEKADIARGLALLQAASPFDLGQACAVIDGHVVAMEDIGGTDSLLRRIAQLRQDGAIRTRAGRGVLVKAPKTGQDLRFDLPALGSRTVEGAQAAGLAGIAVVAGRAVVADLQAMVDAADRAGLFLCGVTP